MSTHKIATPVRRFLKNRVGRVVTHSGFIATVLGAIAFYWIGFSPYPYMFEITRARSLIGPPPGYYNYFADLNYDGKQEWFYFSNYEGDNSMLLVFKTEKSLVDQWNFKGLLSQQTIGYYIGNYDHDGSMEIACLSARGHSILLNIVEPFGVPTHLVKDRLVDSIWISERDPILNIDDARFCDLNNDGSEELLFSLSAGRARQPRKVYAYDIKADSLWSSPLSGTAFKSPLVMDFDHDGRKELFCVTDATNNYPDGRISYPDTTSWFVVLDDRLRFKTPPVAGGGLWSRTSHYLMVKDSGAVLYAVVTGNNDLGSFSDWFIVNADFSLTATATFLDRKDFCPERIVRSSSGQAQMFYEPLNRRRSFVSEGTISDCILPANSIMEVNIYNHQAGLPQIEFAIVLEGMKESVLLLSRTGKKLGKIELDSSDQGYRICWMGVKDGKNQLLLSGYKWEFEITVRSNPFLYLQYLILMGLIAGFYGFIVLIRFIQSQQIARQEAIRRDVLELQLKAVRNQLDPHFTFNALNTLSGLSLTGDKKGVDHFINHFSRLLRTHLQTSDKIMVPLKEEIEFVVNYVELQRIRFDNVFCLELDVPKEVDLGTLIPKMLIQTHVENAIKHGFRGLRASGPGLSTGRLLVQIRESDKALVIIIEDNGVGRGNSKVPEFESTGKGLLSIDRIREAVKQLYGIRITQVVEDLFGEGGRAVGTRVVVSVEG